MSLQDQLQELSALDHRVRGLRTRLDAGTRRQTATQRKRDQLQQQHQELADQVKHLKSEVATLESEAQGMDQKITRLREQMNSVDTNKQYQAMLVEVNTLKLAKGKSDDAQLEKMGQLEELQVKHDELKARLDAQQALVKSAEDEVESARAEVGEKLDEAQSERNASAEKIPDDVRLMFDRLADANDGEAVVPVEEQDRRRMEYICSGCYMGVPVERINALMTRPDELVTCPNCSRILTIENELRSSLSPSS